MHLFQLRQRQTLVGMRGAGELLSFFIQQFFHPEGLGRPNRVDELQLIPQRKPVFLEEHRPIRPLLSQRQSTDLPGALVATIFRVAESQDV